MHPYTQRYKFFYSPMVRDSRVTRESLDARNKRVATFFDAADGVKIPPSPQLAWQTVRAVARFAPLDAGLAQLHDAAKLAALAPAERAARAARAPAAAELPPACTVCAGKGGEGAPLLVCTRCKAAVYCSVKCQRDDWPTHKAGCDAEVAVPGAAGAAAAAPAVADLD